MATKSADRPPPLSSRDDEASRVPGMRVQLRRRQHLPLERIGNDSIRIERGCVMLHAPAAGRRGNLALVLHPGDLISLEAAPPLPGIGLTAATPATIIRQSPSQAGAEAGAGAAANAFARLAARSVLHGILLNELNAGQRLATFLLELALRFGVRTPAGWSFELPLSRTDMAHYLGLNPDTLSRLMSRLRAQDVLVIPARGWAAAPDLARLAALSPLAPALLKLWSGGEAASALREAGARRG